MPATSVADHTSYATMFSTRLFMPGWWVRAFDTVTGLPPDTTMHAIDVARKMQVLPALDLAELNALAAIICDLQEQILSHGDATLRLDPGHFEKHANTASRSRVYAFAKVLQWLPALRLLRDDGQKLEATPVFIGEQWLKTKDDLALDLRLHPMGAEVLLGYTCSHLELLRKVEGKPLGQNLLGAQAPLSFWRSAWMELQGAEQAFLVRLEKAMQWENRWLHFDGIFGKNVSELMRGLDVRIPKRQLELRRTKLARIQWLLDKVGRKLVHQGLIQLDVDNEYLALSERHDQGTQLVWQVTGQKAASEEVDRYLQSSMAFLQRYRLAPRMEELVRTLAPAEHDLELESIGRNLTDAVGSEPLLCRPIAQTGGPAPVLPIPTFLEWRARQQPGHPVPLPQDLRDSEPALACKCAPEDALGQVTRFAQMMHDSLELRESFQRLPLTSISQPDAWSDQSLARYFKEKSTVVNKVEQSPHKVALPAKTEKTSGAERISEQTLQPIKQSMNLRRLANDELTKLREQEPARYKDLKQNYLNSLDDARRKLILDLQGRVSPEHFDNHLKGSLVKYMIENPSVWRSAGTSQAQQSSSRH